MPLRTSQSETTRVHDAPGRNGQAGGLRLVRQLRRARRAVDGIPEGSSSRVVLRRDAVYRRSLAVADVFAAVTGMLVGIQALGDEYLLFGAYATLPLVVLAGKILGLYDRDEQLLRKTT